MMKFAHGIPIVLFFLLLLSAVAPLSAQNSTPEPGDPSEAAPSEILVERQGLTPEGIDYDAAGERFLLGSLSEGTIFAVTDSGELSPLIEDEDFKSTVGIEVDAANNRLLVAISDRAVFEGGAVEGMLIGLGAYDLESGERLFLADLSDLLDQERQFANDVAVDDAGNAYVTNSFAPVIYRVDMEGNADIFIEDENLGASGFGLNGIVYHPDGYLLATVAASQRLFKIPVDDPSAITEVALETPFGADGMVLDSAGNLAAVTNLRGQQVLALVVSEDDWASASISAQVETGGAATTVAMRDEAFYYINAYLSQPQQEVYEIVRVDFAAMSQ